MFGHAPPIPSGVGQVSDYMLRQDCTHPFAHHRLQHRLPHRTPYRGGSPQAGPGSHSPPSDYQHKSPGRPVPTLLYPLREALCDEASVSNHC